MPPGDACEISMPPFALYLLAAAAGPTQPALGTGPLDTLLRGYFACETPGDASGPAGIDKPAESFEVISGSRYKDSAGRGTYLRKGSRVTMTSGPRKGTQYDILSEQHLLKVGSEDGLRCYWRGRLFD